MSLTRHFRPIDQTTKRLVTRCIKVPWLCSPPDNAHLAETFASTLNLGVSHPSGNVSTTSVHTVAAVRKPPPCMFPLSCRKLTSLRGKDATKTGKEDCGCAGGDYEWESH